VDFIQLPRVGSHTLERAIVVRGERHFRSARDGGRGVIVLSVHAGNWEWGAAYLAARGVPVHVVARAHASASVESFFARRRAAWGVARLCGRPLWLAASAALRRHEWVALMADRSAPGARGSLCAWAAALARRTGAVVLPATMTRLEDGRYLARFEPPLDAAACAEGRFREAMLRHVRRWPGQWFAFEPLPEAVAGPA
jgi:KDO2-lipid IV(A) lauroyltransferase